MTWVCSQCGEPINNFDYYLTPKGEYIFCSEDCCKEFYKEHKEYYTFYDVDICPGYNDCKKFDNIRDMCKYEKKINLKPKNRVPYDNRNVSKMADIGKRCSPAQISIIRSNIKLFDFVKKTEEESSKLNQETLKHTRINTGLAVAMLITSVVNLIIFIL